MAQGIWSLWQTQRDGSIQSDNYGFIQENPNRRRRQWSTPNPSWVANSAASTPPSALGTITTKGCFTVKGRAEEQVYWIDGTTEEVGSMRRNYHRGGRVDGIIDLHRGEGS